MATMNIFGTLFTARGGLMAQQGGLTVTGQNVANVNTEGYSRRSISLASLPGPPLGGGGVEILGIKRYFDQFANSRLTQEESVLGNANQRSEILAHVSDLFNDLAGLGLGTALDDFFGSIRLLESAPTDVTVRQEVLARGQEVVSAFNRISTEIETVRHNIDNILASSASEVNLRTEQIADLNEEITLGLVQGIDVSDLYDRRDQLVREIAEHINVNAIENDDHQLTVFLEGGLPLVDGKTQSLLQVETSAAPGASAVEYVSSNGQISDITSRIQGGSMGGALSIRDTVLPGFSTQLDELALDLVTAVNTQHRAGYDLNGNTDNYFFSDLTVVTNAAGLIQLHADVDGNPDAIAAAEDPLMLPGDNRNALALADLAEQQLATGNSLTFNEAYAGLVGEVGVATRRASDEATMRATSISHIETIRDSQAGVSLDEEMANLIQFQRGYQASARVLSAVDEVIQTLINLR